MRRREGRLREPFPPRYQAVPETAWSIAEWGVPGTIVGMLRVRCTMRDWPGDLGRVARIRYGSPPVPSEPDWYEYQAPRDFHAVPDTRPREFRLGERGRAYRARGEPLSGRGARPPGTDWDPATPLGAHDKPGTTYGLGDGTGRDSDVIVHCPHCPRKVRVTRAGAAAKLDEA